jgi:hypothetical protein
MLSTTGTLWMWEQKQRIHKDAGCRCRCGNYGGWVLEEEDFKEQEGGWGEGAWMRLRRCWRS